MFGRVHACRAAKSHERVESSMACFAAVELIIHASCSISSACALSAHFDSEPCARRSYRLPLQQARFVSATQDASQGRQQVTQRSPGSKTEPLGLLLLFILKPILLSVHSKCRIEHTVISTPTWQVLAPQAAPQLSRFLCSCHVHASSHSGHWSLASAFSWRRMVRPSPAAVEDTVRQKF
jgi:hypothetical protein